MLGECLLTSSLPGNASRTLAESLGSAEHSTQVLKAKSDKHGKLNIKRCESGILFISLPIGLLFILTIMMSLPISASTSLTSFKKSNVMLTL